MPIAEMTELAVTLVISTIDGEELHPSPLIPPRLVRGRSTAPAPEL
jgi:DNA-binding LacI/PurR family transcriptional regulator